MFFRLQPIIYSLIFLVALEVFAIKDDFAVGVIIFLVIFSFFIIWPLARKLRFLAIPLFLSLSSVSLLYLINHRVEKQIFIFLSFFIYYISVLGAYRLKMYRYDTTAQGMINLATLVIAFFWFTSNIGWFLNFKIENWILVLTFFASSFLISLPSLSLAVVKKEDETENKNGKVKSNHKAVSFLTLILATLMSQWAWAITFWPFGYLTTGVITLIVFYMTWDVIRSYLKRELTVQRFMANAFLSFLLLIGILMTTSWDLMV